MRQGNNVHDTDVLVVGAGPTGLTLAFELARRGVSHRIIDRNDGPATGSRGKGLQPRSLEVLADLGVIDQILAAGETGLPLRLHQGEKFTVELATSAGTGPRPGIPYPDLVLLPQWRVEQALRDRLEALGGEVAFDSALASIEQGADGVVAVLENGDTVRARYLVGSDGGHSTVRHLLGATMTGRTHDDQYFLVGDVRIAGLASDAAYAWFTEDSGYLAVSPLPHADGAWQFQANVRPAQDGSVPEPTLETFRELFATRSGRRDVTLSEPTWLSRYRFNARMVDRYRYGRVFLAGDAAHVHSPAGGQGMNTGIQDSYNLGWKLSAVLAGADDALLDSYGLERIPVAAKVLAGSSRGFESVFGLRGVRRFLRDHVIFPLVKRPAVMVKLLAKTDQLAVAYPDSPLTLTDPSRRRGPRPGDRAPDARGTTIDGTRARLFDITRGTHWTILGFGARTAAKLREFADEKDVLTCLVVDSATCTDTVSVFVSVEARRLLHAKPGTLILIRPDGYIAARSTDSRVLADYLVRTLSTTLPPSGKANSRTLGRARGCRRNGITRRR
ncbi:FAD-dependent oxidoreductase [Nocardia sp. NPDC023988]|uniref:FAD-dependent oxidoreductase n=1 Tax=unclassified Nocardia TaxID=2637762 RepID=UPI0033D8044A